jgi:homocysteine S-methyltransferase
MTRNTSSARLPQQTGGLFLADGGIETSLIFLQGLELPHFAAFHLLRDGAGKDALEAYFRAYVALARRHRTGLVLESATWRASRDWGERLGYDEAGLAAANESAVRQLVALREAPENRTLTIVVSGCVGPRGDGYMPASRMSVDEAANYHADQVETLARSGADLVTAITMNYAEEAIGVARAAEKAGVPVVLSFTVETDGRLPTSQSLADAITAVDAATGAYASYYMVNCAHPTHFDRELTTDAAWVERVRGLRANASRQSHAELNESPTLDRGDPEDLAARYAALCARRPSINVLGGCCGTDEDHIDAVARACAPLFAQARS